MASKTQRSSFFTETFFCSSYFLVPPILFFVLLYFFLSIHTIWPPLLKLQSPACGVGREGPYVTPLHRDYSQKNGMYLHRNNFHRCHLGRDSLHSTFHPPGSHNIPPRLHCLCRTDSSVFRCKHRDEWGDNNLDLKASYFGVHCTIEILCYGHTMEYNGIQWKLFLHISYEHKRADRPEHRQLPGQDTEYINSHIYIK